MVQQWFIGGRVTQRWIVHITIYSFIVMCFELSLGEYTTTESGKTKIKRKRLEDTLLPEMIVFNLGKQQIV